MSAACSDRITVSLFKNVYLSKSDYRVKARVQLAKQAAQALLIVLRAAEQMLLPNDEIHRKYPATTHLKPR